MRTGLPLHGWHGGGLLVWGTETALCAQPGQSLVDERIVPPCLDPAHLAHDGRGVATFAPRKRAERTSLLRVGEIHARRLWQPCWSLLHCR
ncbi:hypothetical protein RGUI_0136 [Rhodovulum sp. P5]|nr:hypothetical protein RGUI_0136 [Rhodovulum sp. P5]